MGVLASGVLGRGCLFMMRVISSAAVDLLVLRVVSGVGVMGDGVISMAEAGRVGGMLPARLGGLDPARLAVEIRGRSLISTLSPDRRP
jgi:hypothetical protein